MQRVKIALLAVVATTWLACSEPPPPPLYEEVAVGRRDIAVSVAAAGVIEPVRTVDVKSKASGEIISMQVETGDEVGLGELMARIDPRVQRNALAQAQANLEVARARLQNAEAQKRRADELFARGSIAETEYETSNLAHATARADVVGAETQLENARDQMEDTSVKAPIRGTILQKSAELGTVISSPTSDVGGGSILFRMANLDTMQVRALVDETDIGKVQAGPEAMVRVDAYANRTFRGRVLKVEPQAVIQQNVTLFPVIIAIDNPGHLLRPGMNAEVQLDIGSRENAIAVPNAVLRTERDVASAAEVLGLDPGAVQEQLASARAARDSTRQAAPAAATAGRRGGSGNRGPGARRSGSFGGRYIVFEMQGGKPTPVEIETGLTDLDYIEVVRGLTVGDTVLVLPSASLVAQQKEMRERMQQRSGGLPGVQRTNTGGSATTGAPPAGGGSDRRTPGR